MSDAFGFEECDGGILETSHTPPDSIDTLSVGDIVALARGKNGLVGYVKTINSETGIVSVIPIRHVSDNKWVRDGQVKHAYAHFFTRVPTTTVGLEVRI